MGRLCVYIQQYWQKQEYHFWGWAHQVPTTGWAFYILSRGKKTYLGWEIGCWGNSVQDEKHPTSFITIVSVNNTWKYWVTLIAIQMAIYVFDHFGCIDLSCLAKIGYAEGLWNFSLQFCTIKVPYYDIIFIWYSRIIVVNINPSTLVSSLLPFLFVYPVYVPGIISKRSSDDIIGSRWDLTGFDRIWGERRARMMPKGAAKSSLRGL